MKATIHHAFAIALLWLLPQNAYSRRLGEQDERDLQPDFQNLRYLNFGSSHSWGAGLTDRHRAYPFLLSKDVTNLALRGNGPGYPSVCTESMVGDSDIFDVITLEFHPRGYDGLPRLARRLRQRFPDAIIIFIRLWAPINIRIEDERTIQDWYRDFHHGESLYDEKLKELVLAEPETTFHFKNLQQADALQDETVEEVGGHLIKLYRPDDPRSAIARYPHMFSDDWHHPSEHAHHMIAHQIKDLLGLLNPQPSNRLGTWGAGDECHNFYESGKVDLRHDPGFVMKKFHPRAKKYALELKEPASITVTNKFDGPRELYLVFMVTGPPPSIYPHVLATFPGTDIPPVEIDPVSRDDFGQAIHISKLQSIATIPPGQYVVHFLPLEKKDVPFRLTGVSITGQLDIGPFGYEPAPV